MALFGFGTAKKLEDLKIDDLRKERTRQEVRQDRLLLTIRRAQEEYDRRLDIASEPGKNSAERQVAAYRMSEARKRKDRAEDNIQRVITQISVLDETINIINMKKDLQKRGIWKLINEMDAAALESQMEEVAVKVKGSDNKLETVISIFDRDPSETQFYRGAGYDNALGDIERAAREKAQG